MKKDVLRVGRLFEVLPLGDQLFKTLRESGMSQTEAAFWIYRSAIRFGGGEAKYDGARKRLATLEGRSE